jgi:hypothetical protein
MKVGVVVSRKKEVQLGARGIGPERTGIQYFFLHSVEELKAVSPDIILSKICEELDPNLIAACSAYRQLIDPSLQSIFSDRFSLHDKIRAICNVPDSILVESTVDMLEIYNFITKHGRVILKPRIAAGPLSAHNMAICESLKDVQSHPGDGNFLLQRLVPHEDYFLKVFLVGEYASVHVRKSIDANKVGAFNSQGLFSSTSHVNVSDNVQRNAKKVASRISAHLRVYLLGVDIVVDSQTNQLLVVDVNYFPSFSEIGENFLNQLDRFCEVSI